jgi:3-methyladenine DNA glycosylase AlkC
MSIALKDHLGTTAVRRIASELHGVHPSFDVKTFLRKASRLGDRSLTERARYIATVMRAMLPEDPLMALGLITRSFGPPLTRPYGNGPEVLRYLPHAYFIATYGLDHFDASMAATHALTQRFTGEFTVRPFLERYPEAMLAVLSRWVLDPSEHVRRLVSEGTRPRLPWAPRLAVFERDPSPVLALLTILRDDPSPYVRRSVANHLNDLTKTHPTLVLDLAERWRDGATDARFRLLRHALRTLVRAGDERALKIVGASTGARASVTSSLTPKRLHIGETLTIELTVMNNEPYRAHFVLDVVVHFVRADGSTRPKVFKLCAVTLASAETATVTRSISFRQHSTRTHYPGKHRVDALVNGVATPIGVVTVRAPVARRARR